MLNQKERNEEEETIPDRYIYEAVPELLGPGNHQQSPRIYVVELTENPELSFDTLPAEAGRFLLLGCSSVGFS